jgi:hypothetical protein
MAAVDIGPLKSEVLRILQANGIDIYKLVDFMFSDVFKLNDNKTAYVDVEYDNITIRKGKRANAYTYVLDAFKTSNPDLKITICEYTDY